MRRLALVLVLSMGAAGCASAGSTDKTGERTVVLRVVNFDSLDPNGQSPAPTVFLRQLIDLSGGRVKVDVTNQFEDGQPTAETDEIAAVKSGEYDLAWPSTRAFGAAGITSLQALEVPLLITSLDAERALVTAPVADDLLTTLHGHGIVGLGLTVGPLRRPMATKPLLSVADWKDTRFRYFNATVQDAFLKALGAKPVNVSYDFPSLVGAGELDGIESDVAQYDENGLGDLLSHVTRNVVLWARMSVFIMNAGTFDRLSSTQRGWVMAAARAAVKASMDYNYDEATPAAAMCRDGVRFHDASAAALRELQVAVHPVVDRIAADQVSGPLLAGVRSALAGHPGIDLPDIPTGCLR
jgi:TRAP-type C4-dicarboxylate transport system substrate-binding protein